MGLNLQIIRYLYNFECKSLPINSPIRILQLIISFLVPNMRNWNTHTHKMGFIKLMDAAQLIFILICSSFLFVSYGKSSCSMSLLSVAIFRYYLLFTLTYILAVCSSSLSQIRLNQPRVMTYSFSQKAFDWSERQCEQLTKAYVQVQSS